MVRRTGIHLYECLRPQVYAYDEVYDSMKSYERVRHEETQRDKVERRPKYMENLIRSAQVRKRDLLRARERMLQLEREREGEQFADKETFVTSAYKKQQEELARMEEEEARYEAELRAKGSGGASTFYRNLLNQEEDRHRKVVDAAAAAPASARVAVVDAGGENRSHWESFRAERSTKEASDRVIRNDDNEVVDKRQLLTAGLNVAPRRREPEAAARWRNGASGPRGGGNGDAGDGAGADMRTQREAQQKRQQAQLERQRLDLVKRQAEEERAYEEELRLRAKRTKTDEDVNSARARYLARKQAAAGGPRGAAQGGPLG